MLIKAPVAGPLCQLKLIDLLSKFIKHSITVLANSGPKKLAFLPRKQVNMLTLAAAPARQCQHTMPLTGVFIMLLRLWSIILLLTLLVILSPLAG